MVAEYQDGMREKKVQGFAVSTRGEDAIPTTTTFLRAPPSLNLSQHNIPKFLGRANKKNAETWLREVEVIFVAYQDGREDESTHDHSSNGKWITCPKMDECLVSAK